MIDDKTNGLSPEQTAILVTLANRIASIDPHSTFGLVDIGEALWEAGQQASEEIVDAWAIKRCKLTIEQRYRASRAYFAIEPHRHRLEQMSVSSDVVLTLLEGVDEDVDHGVDAMETYGPISVPVLKVLMAADERGITALDSHPLLRFGTTALQELIALKTNNGMAIFQNTLARLIALTLSLEVADLNDKEVERIRLDLKTGAEEAIALFENLALLPHRRINAPDYIHASWPPVASAWTQFDEAMLRLRYPVDPDERDLAAVRDVMQRLLGV